MNFVKVDSNFGDTFYRISDLILENPLNFKKTCDRKTSEIQYMKIS